MRLFFVFTSSTKWALKVLKFHGRGVNNPHYKLNFNVRDFKFLKTPLAFNLL